MAKQQATAGEAGAGKSPEVKKERKQRTPKHQPGSPHFILTEALNKMNSSSAEFLRLKLKKDFKEDHQDPESFEGTAYTGVQRALKD